MVKGQFFSPAREFNKEQAIVMSTKCADKHFKLLQAASLANSVIAYANYCDNLPALTQAVEVIANKHVSFHILPEHYQYVGMELLCAIKVTL
ncbi:MAG TPA: hypothetical protein EYQ69_09155 [Gemmatimonadetes bacterium]|nr:hypothetical protein [Gemmatimonadota bacterium]